MIKELKQPWRIEKNKGIFNGSKQKELLRFTTAGSVDDGKEYINWKTFV